MVGDYNIAALRLSPFSSFVPMDESLDAVLLCSDGSFNNTLFPRLEALRLAEIPVFLHGTAAFNRLEAASTLSAAEDLGVVLLQTLPNQDNSVYKGLERIFDKESTFEGRRTMAKEVFSRPDFYRSLAFLDLVINPTLKQFADGLPMDAGPIVVDCGHIDASNSRPTVEDITAFEEGLVLIRYLQHLGHEDVKLGILYNEVYLLDESSDLIMRMGGGKETTFHLSGTKKNNRRSIKRAQKDIKREGLPARLNLVYGHVLFSYGVTPNTWADSIVCTLEGSLSFQARQSLEAYENGREHPFQVELDAYGNAGFSFTAQDGKERVVASADRGAPMCSLISSGLNRVYDDGTVIYLYNKKWRPGIRCGAVGARELYGADLTVHAFFYGKTPEGRVGIEAYENLS
ncbi:hypothetical protein COV16_07015 [Candidatus Woesearchaeota archaeon CG10_big_fil_rev_8_21_14_0_10_34_8]|nr:MAG: hypothetical protein COV16_07015 [Candidatus Woesearchaeota archaeon CG10_big_fil_rev_8_21_14_0_10_34_8]